jgi:hypothetical protein
MARIRDRAKSGEIDVSLAVFPTCLTNRPRVVNVLYAPQPVVSAMCTLALEARASMHRLDGPKSEIRYRATASWQSVQYVYWPTVAGALDVLQFL